MKKWAEAFYKGKNWIQTQAAFIKSNCLCERCAKEGKVEAAKIAHHRTWLTQQNINDPMIAYA